MKRVSGNDVQNTRLIMVHYTIRSHSAIFQLYSDRAVVQFPTLDLLPGIHAKAARGLSRAEPTTTRDRRHFLLAIRGPTRGDGTPGIEPGSPYPLVL